jgi:anti-sigma regulatory factor (Ser/Thr protein kinase)
MPELATHGSGSCALATLRPVRQSPELARTFVRHRLLTFGTPERRVDDGCMIASELVTNVVMHVPWAETLRLFVTKNGLSPLIEVWDPSTVRPVIVDRSDSESGRGLLIVAALAKTWYCATLPPERGGGKIVAALL